MPLHRKRWGDPWWEILAGMMVPKMTREIHVRAGSAGRREFKTFLCPCPGSVVETRLNALL